MPYIGLHHTIIVVIGIHHLLASSFTPLLSCIPPPIHPFSVKAAYFSASSPSPPASPPPSPPPPYLHSVLFDCCVLRVIVVVRCCLVSFSTPPPCQRSRHCLVRQPPTAIFHFLLKATSSSHPKYCFSIILLCIVLLLCRFPFLIRWCPSCPPYLPLSSSLSSVVCCHRHCRGRWLRRHCHHHLSCCHLPPPLPVICLNVVCIATESVAVSSSSSCQRTAAG